MEALGVLDAVDIPPVCLADQNMLLILGDRTCQHARLVAGCAHVNGQQLRIRPQVVGHIVKSAEIWKSVSRL